MERFHSCRHDHAFTLQFTHAYRACISGDLFSMSLREAGANGAVSFLAWGNAPGSVEALLPALKVRFTFAKSAIENQLLDETRFQRLFTGLSNSWGRCPMLKLTSRLWRAEMDNEAAQHR